MTPQDITLRQAHTTDSDTVATIARESRQHFLPFLPNLHSLEGDKSFFRNRVFPTSQVWVAECDTDLIGFCAVQEDWVDHLYLRPGFTGKSLGTRLLERAKDGRDYLQLWVFQQNTRAIRFYERGGFTLVRETDGANNEEKTPDALYEWHRFR